jgi:cytidylate kinase
MTRAASPLVASDDAVLLDTTGMPVDAVVRRVLEIVRERLSSTEG